MKKIYASGTSSFASFFLFFVVFFSMSFLSFRSDRFGILVFSFRSVVTIITNVKHQHNDHHEEKVGPCMYDGQWDLFARWVKVLGMYSPKLVLILRRSRRPSGSGHAVRSLILAKKSVTDKEESTQR